MDNSERVEEISFPQFNELPKEIRLAIWEASLPGPRIVDLREKLLKVKIEDFKQHIQKCKSEREQQSNERIDACVDNVATARALREESWLEHVNSIEIPSHLLEAFTEKRKMEPMHGLKSRCHAPDILFACRESHEVAIRSYELAFDTVASQPQTWFNFHQDILYLRWDNFNATKSIFGRKFDDLMYYIPYVFEEKCQCRIENLALLMNKKGVVKCDVESLEELLASILCAFGGVKNLILVAKHVGSYSGGEHNYSQLSLHDPIDTDYLEVHHSYPYSHEEDRAKMEIIHDIPELDIDWLQVDLEELQRLSEETTEERPTPWTVPKIEYKIVVPVSYQPFLHWIEEKRLETLAWENEERERSQARGHARALALSLLSNLPFDVGDPASDYVSDDDRWLDSEEDLRYQFDNSDSEEY
ncbi:hypothetical protein EG329_000078 [Mollisiaceae sp. DMI_Dod_QoI]|nr:hypothetical protein EG329_000078 [Helotiales sp. DMI_Dod_QoI]